MKKVICLLCCVALTLSAGTFALAEGAELPPPRP